MTWIDADDDPSTFDSSSSDLNLPTGATVLFAGLYYGGKLGASSGGSPAPNPSANNKVLFKAPGDTGYQHADDGHHPRYILDPVPGVRQRHQHRPGRGRRDLLDRERAARHGAQRRHRGRLGAGRGLRRPQRPQPQPVDLRRAAERVELGQRDDPAERLSDAADRSGERRRSGWSPTRATSGTTGDGASIQGGSGSFTALSNAVANPASNVFNSTISNNGGVRHLEAAELPEQPRLRRRSVQHDERARQQPAQHPGQAVDERGRLSARRW